MLLGEKVAIVTGGGRGIGRAIALKLAGEGALIAVAARTESEIEAVAKQIRNGAGHATAIVADMSDEEQCEHLFNSTVRHFGRVDIVVNNAGEYGPVKPVEEITTSEWDHVIAVHLRAAYLLTRMALPGMYARGYGVILNISSLSAKSAFPWGSPYAAAKAGMLGLTRVVAAEGARKGVRVNAICPGPVTETKMSKDLGETLAKRLGVSEDDQLKGFLNTILQGRGQTPNEIADAALFLCSEHASAITGQALNVDGGGAFY
jgi:3-hydroxybutyrate dehydrogenase